MDTSNQDRLQPEKKQPSPEEFKAAIQRFKTRMTDMVHRTGEEMKFTQDFAKTVAKAQAEERHRKALKNRAKQKAAKAARKRNRR